MSGSVKGGSSLAGAPGPGWLRELFRAARLLAFGSVALLLAAFAWIAAVRATSWSYGFAALFLVPMLSGIGVGLHATSWVRLRRASRGSMASMWTFRGSLFGLAVGLLTLPWVFWIFALPLIPMIPSVFGPVVIAHAILFMLFARSFANRIDATIAVAGSGLLIVDAVAALLAQAFVPGALPGSLWGPPPTFILMFAGATAPGYGIIAFGAWRALARAEPGETGAAGPSRAHAGPTDPIERQDSAF